MAIIIVNIVNSAGYRDGKESVPYIFTSFDEAYDFIKDDYEDEMVGSLLEEDYCHLLSKEDVSEAIQSEKAELVALVQKIDHHIQYEMFLENI